MATVKEKLDNSSAADSSASDKNDNREDPSERLKRRSAAMDSDSVTVVKVTRGDDTISAKLQADACSTADLMLKLCKILPSDVAEGLELWGVSSAGVESKLEADADLIALKKRGTGFVLLNPDVRIVIVYFPDGSFASPAIPWHFTAKELCAGIVRFRSHHDLLGSQRCLVLELFLMRYP